VREGCTCSEGVVGRGAGGLGPGREPLQMHMKEVMVSRMLKEENRHEQSKFEFMALSHRNDNELRPGALRVMVLRPARAWLKCMRVWHALVTWPSPCWPLRALFW